MCSISRSTYPAILKLIWAEHVFGLHLISISYSFWNKGWKVLKFWKFDEKREITPKLVMGFTPKLQGG
jgi:hypothetical protein